MNLASAPQSYDQGLFQKILGRIGAAIDGCWQKRQDIRLVNGERFTLKSPNGTEYKLGVSDAGATTWTAL